MADKSKKLIANELGDFAEELAAQEYIKKGYAVLERKWRLGKTEIDLIAQKDNEIVIVEVKARSGRNEDPLSAVTSDKRKRMIRAADNYLRRLEGDYFYRFDIATFSGDLQNYSLSILEDAFVAADLF